MSEAIFSQGYMGRALGIIGSTGVKATKQQLWLSSDIAGCQGDPHVAFVRCMSVEIILFNSRSLHMVR